MSTILRHLRTAAFFLCSSALALPCDSAFANEVRIEHVTIVSAERAAPLENATVSIRDDKITRISSGNSAGALRGSHPGPQIIDGHGLYLVPGLMDSHVHLSSLAGMTAEQENLHPDIARCAAPNATQFPALRLCNSCRPDFDTRDHEPLEFTGNRTRHVFLRSCGAEGRVSDGLCAEAGPVRYVAGIAKIILRGHVFDPAELAASRAQRLGKTGG